MDKPKVVGCNVCDFSSGTRGMDRCSACGGTGSRFLVAVDDEAFFYPNTRQGYERAMTKLGKTPELDAAST